MERNKLYISVLIVLVAPFYLNDFSNIYTKDWRLWIFIDYVFVKLFPLLAVAWLIINKKMQADEFGLSGQPVLSFVTVFVIVTVVGTLIDQNAYKLIEKLPGYHPLGSMPEIKSPVWNWIDLTFGLLLVGILEELIFRGYMHTFISRYTKSNVAVVLISAIAFGLIHWGAGLHVVLVASTIGAVFMLAYLKTHSLPAVMLAHFAVNFIDYAGVIPKSIFKFL